MQASLHSSEPIELPAGGIATFLTAETGSWADEDAIPNTGIASVKQVADQLAEFGRYEDSYMIHAAEGETVVPMAVFDKNPLLKEKLFSQMREMGIDPDEYVVGNELNSLNPVTGQPEFFLKKLFGKLKKGIKKAFKVIAPIVVQTFLTPILGPMGASAATSFLQAKVSGVSTKDAFKRAGIAALTTGILKGAQGAKEFGKGARLDGFKEGFKSSMTGTETLGSIASNKAQEPNRLAQMLGVEPTATQTANTAASKAAEMAPLYDANQSTATVQGGTNQVGDAATLVGPNASYVDPASLPNTTFASMPKGVSDVSNLSTSAAPDLNNLGSDYLNSMGESATYTPPNSVFERGKNIFTSGGRGSGVMDTLGDIKDFVIAPDDAESFMDRFAVPAGIGYLALASNAPTDESAPDFFRSGAALDEFYRDRPRYGYGYGNYRPPGMADGGQAFPRRTGRIAGPGTETSDDIPAMLSDGEFVMTAQAVRGAGNGSRQRGMKKMYDAMRQFESAA